MRSASGLGCVETPKLNLRTESLSPTSINLRNESAGDGRGDKTIEKTILRTFRARTFSHSQGQSLHSDGVLLTSGLPQQPDILGVRRRVSKVPTGDIVGWLDNETRHQTETGLRIEPLLLPREVCSRPLEGLAAFLTRN